MGIIDVQQKVSGEWDNGRGRMMDDGTVGWMDGGRVRKDGRMGEMVHKGEIV
jgi:hypothetical protein